MTGPQVSPTEGAAADATGTPQTPHEIADTFRDQLREAGTDAGFLPPEKAARKSVGRPPKNAAPAAPVVPAPIWTAEGIGETSVLAHNLAFVAFDVPELEPEEAKQVREAAASFMNAAWPQGATWEPHARLLLTEASVIVPRIAAYQMRRKAEEEKKKNEKMGKSEESPQPHGLG
jgi:hypothetical protein